MKERIIEIGRDSAWYLGVNLINAVIGFIAIPIFTRIFVPAEYGIYALVNTSITLGAPIIFTYLQNSVMRFYPEYEKKGELETFYSTSFHYVPHFLALFLAVILPLSVFVLPLGEYRLVICLGIATFALYVIYNVLLGLLRIRQMTWQYATAFVFVQFCNYIVGAGIAVWLNAGIAGPFWGWMGALILAVPLQFAALHVWRQIKWRMNSPGLQKEFFRFGFPLVFATLLAEIMTAADRYMVQIVKGAYQVGLYTVVYALIMSIERVMIGFVIMGAVPVIYKVYEHEGEERAIDLIKRVTRYFLIILVPVIVGLCVLRDPVVHVITSPKYYGASSVVIPLAVGIFLNNLSWLPHLSFRLKKKTNITLIPMGIAAASNILINLALIPRYSYAGAAWATLISYCLYFAMLTAIGWRLMRWEFPWLGALKIAAASAVMGTGVYGLFRLGLHGAWGLVAMAAAGALIYFTALLLLGGVTRAERRYIVHLAARVPVVGTLLSRFEKKDDGEG